MCSTRWIKLGPNPNLSCYASICINNLLFYFIYFIKYIFNISNLTHPQCVCILSFRKITRPHVDFVLCWYLVFISVHVLLSWEMGFTQCQRMEKMSKRLQIREREREREGEETVESIQVLNECSINLCYLHYVNPKVVNGKIFFEIC